MEQENSKYQKCENTFGAFSGITIDGKQIIAGTLRCNSWTCPVCQPILKKRLYRRILQGEIASNGTSRYGLKFLTLTFGGSEKRIPYQMRAFEKHIEKDSEGKETIVIERTGPYLTMTYWSKKENKYISGPVYDSEQIYEEMNIGFHKMIRALKKKWGHFHYFKVCELHEDGIPHFHVLFAGDAIIPKGILTAIEKLWCEKYEFGFVKINCIKFKNKKHAVSYMLKYITKNVKKVAKYKRIFTASRDALLKLVKPEWLIMNLFMGKVIDKGIRVENLSGENEFGYCGFKGPEYIKLVPKIDILKLIADRYLNYFLIAKEV